MRGAADDDEEELLLKLMSEHSTGFTPKKTKPATQSSGKAAAVKSSADSGSSVRPASSNNQVRTLPLATHTRVSVFLNVFLYLFICTHTSKCISIRTYTDL